ncbi:MAG: hypothetical protein H6577_10950 [Lewinellaceae bacterium]|nr:hypothetical protein [Saprospiraceae bacterium]MCB9338631.1 hypothetical protein [Lewinellaceae bacterium]
MIKLLIWGVIGYFIYQYFQNKFGLKEGGKQDSIHHHHYHEDKKQSKDDEGDYIDYEELK